VLDSFFEAGVEIMSPHYVAARDGNTAAIPPEQRPAGAVRAFRHQRVAAEPLRTPSPAREDGPPEAAGPTPARDPH
jgi:hypothetical protein